MARTTLEMALYEERAGHSVCVKQPSEDMPLYGVDHRGETDVHTIHSQLGTSAYHDGHPKMMLMHGEPLSSVGNGVSMRAIVDLSSQVDAFICMREAELPVWSSIKKTYLVTKGIDLEFFSPQMVEKLSGEPAVLYYENWRGQRNPLYLCLAMQLIWKKLPKARLHLYNCGDKRMFETFSALITHNKWQTFIRSLKGPVKPDEVPNLLSRADIVVSGLYPLYARGIEAFGCGKAFIGPGYHEHDYPYQCDLDPQSIADAILKCWNEYGSLNFRQWAERHHNVADTVQQSLAVYERYL